MKKFEFELEFQENILRYTVTDRDGYKALNLYDAHYFTLAEHAIIAQNLKNYLKLKKKVPSKIILKERLKKFLRKPDIRKNLSAEDVENVYKIADQLYKGHVKDGQELLEEIRLFASYVQMREATETLELKDFSSYPQFLKRIQDAMLVGTSLKESAGTFLLRDMNIRLLERRYRDNIHPIPITQLNNLTNARGYNTGAIFTVIDKPKAFKTGFLVNVAKMYMRYKKPIIIFDLENGEDSLSMRLEQSLAGIDKLELLSGEHEQKLKKIARKYARIGCEVVIKRLYAGATTDDLQYWMDYYTREFGLKFGYAVIDYVGLMGSIHENIKGNDESRINNAYVEVKNWASKNEIIHTWTGHHVQRAAYSRRLTKYEPEDTALCIGIHRHVDMLLSIQQSEEEEKGGVLRLEVLDQRDGPRGASYFFVNHKHQRLTEFNKAQLEEYTKQKEEAEAQGREAPLPTKPRKKPVSNDL